MRERFHGVRKRMQRMLGEGFRPSLLALSVVLTAAFFFFDLSMPHGMATGVPYLAVVLLVGLHMSSRALLAVGALCTVLTAAGYWLSSAGADPELGAVNRLLAVFAIWVSAGLLYRFRGVEAALRASHGRLETFNRELEREIEERRRAQEELGRFQATLRQTRDTIFMFDPVTLRFFYTNRGAWEQVGYTEAELRGMTPLQLKPALDEQAFRDLCAPLLDGSASSVTFETVHRHKDGHDIPVEVLLQLIRPEGGDARFLAIVRDISERMLAERKAREGDARLRLLTDAVPAMIAYVDAEGRYRFNNKLHARNLGSTAEKLYGRRMNEVFTPEAFATFEDAVRRALAGEEIINEARARYPDGVERDYRAVYIPDVAADGTVRGFSLMAEDITERKRAEEELRASQRLLETVFDTLPIGLFVKDLERRYVMINREAVGRSGTSLAKVIGRRTEEIGEWQSVDKEQVHQEDMRVLSDGILIDVPERSMLLRDGGRQWHRVIKAPLRGEDGATIGLIGVREDITERKRAELALRESELRLRTVVENAPVVLFATDAKGRITLAEGKGLQPLGMEAEELIGQPVFDIIRGDDPAFADEAQRVLAGEVVAGVREFRGLLFDYRLNPVLDKDGNAAGMIGISLDITEAERAREQLRAGQRLLEAIFDIIPVAVFVKDTAGRFLRVNKAFARQLHCAPEEIVTSSGREFFSGTAEQWEQMEAEDREVLERGVMVRTPEKPLTSRGHVRWWDVLKAPLRDDGGNIIGIVGSRVELTERKAVEERLRANQKVEAIGQLAGGVAHEFNNLLQMILGFTELALEATPVTDPRHSNLAIVRNASQRGAGLVRQLLDYSRRQPLEPEVLDVNALIRGRLAMLTAILGPRVPLIFNPGGNVRSIRADAGTIEQAMINLCLNARDAMPDGGQVVIDTEMAPGGGAAHTAGHAGGAGAYVRISVTDTGHGMEPEVVERMFDPFFTTKGPQQGTGLGLSQVYGFINQQGGFIDVVSDPGGGTTLHLCLPPAPEGSPAPRPEPPAAPVHTLRAVHPGRGTVLVAEDEEGVREVTVHTLEGAGLQVLLAGNGAEAVERFERNRDKVDLVLLDVVMPTMGGREAAERICAIRPDVPLVFHTAPGLAQEDVNALMARGHRVLFKPYPAHALRRVVNELLVAKTA